MKTSATVAARSATTCIGRWACFLLGWNILVFAHCRKNVEVRNGISKTSRNCCVYVSLDSEQSIAVYRMHPQNGELQFMNTVKADGAVGSLAVDPSHRYLHAAIRTANSISSFRIDPRTGNLLLLKTIRAVGNPAYLAMDKTGRFLLSAYFADSKAAVYPIGTDGAVEDRALQIISTGQNAHAIQTDPSNRYLFISCRTGENIHQFKFNPATGQLTPNTPDRVTTKPKTGPRHFIFHTGLNAVYVVNEFNSTVTAYRLNPPTGTLSPFQNLSTLPREYTEANATADIHLTPDNRFLYASNRGHDSIAGFSVDPVTGALASVGQFAAEKTPRGFDIDPTGRFLYAGGQGSGKLAAYQIDSGTGQLTRIGTYGVGNNPVWVLVVELPQS